MSSKTKIVVLKLREIIYTVLFAVLAIILVLLLVRMFAAPKETPSTAETSQEASSSEDTRYIAGIYTTPVTLGSTSADVEVIVDENHINSIRLVNLSETATAMYPLVSPALEDIARQICKKQSLEQITCPEDNKYTSQLLLNAIAQALESAKYQSWQ